MQLRARRYLRSPYLLARLQSVLNATARLVFKRGCGSLLHHCFTNSTGWEYQSVLSSGCASWRNPARRSLRSADTTSLLVPSIRRATLGDRAFFVAAPRAWNSLSLALRGTTSLVTFRRDLKVVLFRKSFSCLAL